MSKNNYINPSSQPTPEIIAQKLRWLRSRTIYCVPLTAGSVCNWSSLDTIDHKVFLSLLQEDYGITGGVTDWKESYLLNRHQIVNVNDTHSDKIPLRYGFPQGSKIEPFGFKLYTKHLTAIARKHNIDIHFDLYADDTQLHTSCQNPSTQRTALR